MLNNLKVKFNRFMSGRYGADHLYMATAILFLILQVLNLFAQSLLINLLSLPLIIWTFYRVFSTNISARRAENQSFLKFVQIARAKGLLQKRKIQDIKTHRYRSCANCQTILRLPRKRGIHQAHCPKCGQSTEVRISF